MNSVGGPECAIIIAILVLGVLSFILISGLRQQSMSVVRHCNVCGSKVTPKKDFNWLVFIFLCGICYVPFYLIQAPCCPQCNSSNFSKG